MEGDRGGDMRVFELIEYVGCWHETDMPTALRDVRSQEQSGKHLLTVSSSQFDPYRKSRRWTDGRAHVAKILAWAHKKWLP